MAATYGTLQQESFLPPCRAALTLRTWDVQPGHSPGAPKIAVTSLPVCHSGQLVLLPGHFMGHWNQFTSTVYEKSRACLLQLHQAGPPRQSCTARHNVARSSEAPAALAFPTPVPRAPLAHAQESPMPCRSTLHVRLLTSKQVISPSMPISAKHDLLAQSSSRAGLGYHSLTRPSMHASPPHQVSNGIHSLRTSSRITLPNARQRLSYRSTK